MLSIEGKFNESQAAWQLTAEACQGLAKVRAIPFDSGKLCLQDLPTVKDNPLLSPKLVALLELEWIRTDLEFQIERARLKQTDAFRQADHAFFEARRAIANNDVELARNTLKKAFEDLVANISDERELEIAAESLEPELHLYRKITFGTQDWPDAEFCSPPIKRLNNAERARSARIQAEHIKLFNAENKN